MRKMILFDWDGTLVKNIPIVFASALEVLRTYKKPTNVTMREYISELNNSNGSYIEFYRARGVTASREEINRIFFAHYAKSESLVNLENNVFQILSLLQDEHITGLITAQNEFAVRPLIKRFGIENLFCLLYFHIIDKSSVISRLLFEQEIHPQNCLYVGDTPSDIRHAKKAGVRSVAFLNGHVPYDLLMVEKPHHQIRDIIELLDIIGS